MRKLLPFLAVLLVLIGGYGVYRGWQKPVADQLGQGIQTQSQNLTPTLDEKNQQLLSQLGVRGEDVVTLNPVNGAQGFVAVTRGKDTRELSVAGSLPDLPGGMYQVWLEEAGQRRLLGQLLPEKGGYLLDLRLSKGPSPLAKIIVTREEKIDKNVQTVIFEGKLQE